MWGDAGPAVICRCKISKLFVHSNAFCGIFYIFAFASQAMKAAVPVFFTGQTDSLMRNIFFFLIAAASMALPGCGASGSKGQATADTFPEADSAGILRVMTFNVRYDNPADGENGWTFRSRMVADMIMGSAPDILGTQEVLQGQLEELKPLLKGYAMVGVGRDDGACGGEYAALWYRSGRFDEEASGNFWLSETPDVAGSTGWDAACVRVATWAFLRERATGRRILALNTHLDHVGSTARREGVTLILDSVMRIRGGEAAVVTGDFNSSPDSEVYAHVTDSSLATRLYDSRRDATVVEGPDWSYHDFGRLAPGQRTLIDYIFYAGPLRPVKSLVADTMINGRWLSDHAPVVAEFLWQ